MRKTTGIFLIVASVAVLMATAGAAADSVGPGVSKFTPVQGRQMAGGASQSGIYDFNDQDLGIGITECPQAGNTNPNKELRRRDVDQVEQISSNGDDRRSNADYTCFPQNEVSVDVNPLNSSNFLIGANDYRLGTGSSGFHATTNGGKTFYDGIIPFPSAPATLSRGEGLVISGGDPVSVYDRAGIAYYAQIAFFRGDDTNGVFVQRSTNGGFTWSRACVPVDPADPRLPAPNDQQAACGGPGDARQPADGRVTFNGDTDNMANGSQPFDDKEYMDNGPRPAGVQPTCFTPVTRAPIACNPAVVGVDRLYVTFTRFAAASQIMMSFSDDQARSWSPPKVISSSASFCSGGSLGGNGCDDNQFSIPTVHGKTGVLYVAFENFDTPDENQVLMVRSTDGGNTFQGPFFVSSVFDLNFPRVGITRPDCSPRGAQFGRIVYTNSCFRSNPSGNIVVDERSGNFADDLYYVLADNRNGNIASSNSDVFIVKSINGGSAWTSPTRVNNDRSVTPTMTDPFFNRTGRDCLRPDGTVGPQVPAAFAFQYCGGDFGADQWWPWVDIGRGGELNVAFKDRRLDTNSVAHEWPTSRQRAGNYLVWTFGAQCKVSKADSFECLARNTTVVPQPTAPVNPGADPQPGQGNAFLGTFNNHQVSDVPSNFDYSFRAGIFAGDYENIVVVDGNSSKNDDDDDGEGGLGNGDARAINVFTDARNGRSSRNQPGRNPICEQSDVFFDIYKALGAHSDSVTTNLTPFLVTPCPAQAVDRKQDDDKGKGKDDD